jgi:hypothetical protein
MSRSSSPSFKHVKPKLGSACGDISGAFQMQGCVILGSGWWLFFSFSRGPHAETKP